MKKLPESKCTYTQTTEEALLRTREWVRAEASVGSAAEERRESQITRLLKLRQMKLLKKTSPASDRKKHAERSRTEGGMEKKDVFEEAHVVYMDRSASHVELYIHCTTREPALASGRVFPRAD